VRPPIEQPIGHRKDHLGILRRSELVFLVVPADRRRRLAVPWHVEGDDAVARGDTRVVHQCAILAAIGARGVQAQQRRAAARFLDIDAMLAAEQVEMQIATDGGFKMRAHAAAPARSFTSASLK
jgi:hypothetical protein